MFSITLPLLIASLAGCSSDEDEEILDGVVVTAPNGTRLLIKERESYPDSAIFWLIKVPCRPVAKAQIPTWLFEKMVNYCTNRGSVSAIQGERKDNGRSVYGLVMPSSSSPFHPLYDADGNEFDVSQFTGISPVTDAVYRDFLNNVDNWRCIYSVQSYSLED